MQTAITGLEEKIIIKYSLAAKRRIPVCQFACRRPCAAEPQKISRRYLTGLGSSMGSKYIGQFSGWVDAVKAKQKRGLNSRDALMATAQLELA